MTNKEKVCLGAEAIGRLAKLVAECTSGDEEISVSLLADVVSRKTSAVAIFAVGENAHRLLGLMVAHGFVADPYSKLGCDN